MKTLKLSDIRGHMLAFAKDQVGSRYIQHQIEHSDQVEKDEIFDEVLENCVELVDDIFGNYVIQKFFEHGEPRHWYGLVSALRGKIQRYAKKMYACRVLQKALEKVDEKLQLDILSEIRGQILECMEDQNGNHVVQKAVEKVHPNHIQFIVDALLSKPDKVFEMSVHTYGCRVVQRVLEHCIPEQTKHVIERIHERFEEIVVDQYGNYVIQHVVVHGSEMDKMIIVDKISKNLYNYAIQKFSSNVIEKCFQKGTVQHKNMIVKSACRITEENLPVIVLMMKDQFGNYVVQKMFEEVTPEQRRELVQVTKPHIPYLRQFQYGKPILSRLEKHFLKDSDDSFDNPTNNTNVKEVKQEVGYVENEEEEEMFDVNSLITIEDVSIGELTIQMAKLLQTLLKRGISSAGTYFEYAIKILYRSAMFKEIEPNPVVSLIVRGITMMILEKEEREEECKEVEKIIMMFVAKLAVFANAQNFALLLNELVCLIDKIFYHSEANVRQRVYQLIGLILIESNNVREVDNEIADEAWLIADDTTEVLDAVKANTLPEGIQNRWLKWLSSSVLDKSPKVRAASIFALSQMDPNYEFIDSNLICKSMSDIDENVRSMAVRHVHFLDSHDIDSAFYFIERCTENKIRHQLVVRLASSVHLLSFSQEQRFRFIEILANSDSVRMQDAIHQNLVESWMTHASENISQLSLFKIGHQFIIPGEDRADEKILFQFPSLILEYLDPIENPHATSIALKFAITRYIRFNTSHATNLIDFETFLTNMLDLSVTQCEESLCDWTCYAANAILITGDDGRPVDEDAENAVASGKILTPMLRRATAMLLAVCQHEDVKSRSVLMNTLFKFLIPTLLSNFDDEVRLDGIELIGSASVVDVQSYAPYLTFVIMIIETNKVKEFGEKMTVEALKKLQSICNRTITIKDRALRVKLGSLDIEKNIKEEVFEEAEGPIPETCSKKRKNSQRDVVIDSKKKKTINEEIWIETDSDEDDGCNNSFEYVPRPTRRRRTTSLASSGVPKKRSLLNLDDEKEKPNDFDL
ncbi:unnamed protein product [Caenorhabditis bovis]|uniref:PUM-HD domain-containing protein n=1 Tax=Caenorhabditis bovis TaxID=2654633 RepID=A0A8S1EAL2_9PELO|nr:unnamed protein product [Caenorhabditis bovis]